MAVEHRLHNPALNPLTSTVDQPHLTQPREGRSRNVLLDDRGDVLRPKAVQVDLGLYGYLVWDSMYAPAYGLRYSALTTVLIPPRTEKSPTTVIRRGSRTATRSSRI